MVETTILVKLLCAHFCSDFILQTDRVNKGKRSAGVKGLCFQSAHSLTHAVVAYLLIAQWNNWILPSVILVSHFVIDLVKCRYGRENVKTFLVDQFCHVAIIVILWYMIFCKDVCSIDIFQKISSSQVWSVVMAYLLMLKPSSVLLSLFLRKWAPSIGNTQDHYDESEQSESSFNRFSGGDSQSLPNAGQWIGYIERVLILTFILIDSIECVGFLLAAKSVFRFGELNKANEIKTTEYVLIGTLSSFAIAILAGVLLRSVM